MRLFRTCRSAFTLIISPFPIALITLASCGGDTEQNAANSPEPTIVPPAVGPTTSQQRTLTTSMATLNCNDVVDTQVKLSTANFLTLRAEAIRGAFGKPLVSSGNELHDCGLLVHGTGTQMTGGVFVSIWVFDALKTVATAAQPVSVAGVYNEDGPSDNELRVRQGKSCIWMQREANGYAAWIAPTDGNCAGQYQANPSHRMAVQTISQPTGARYPVGARLIRSKGNNFIGLQCGNQWCVIGDPDRIGTLDAKLISLGAKDHITPLSWVPNTGQFPVISRLWGHIIPAADLEEKNNNPNYYNDRWIHVAHIKIWNEAGAGPLTAPRMHYVRKYRIDPKHAEMDTMFVSVELMKTANGWRVRYNSSYRDKGIKFWTMTGDLGAARFQFSLKDELIWVQCPMGCCGEEDVP
jgi:hypothetical protein